MSNSIVILFLSCPSRLNIFHIGESDVATVPLKHKNLSVLFNAQKVMLRKLGLYALMHFSVMIILLCIKSNDIYCFIL